MLLRQWIALGTPLIAFAAGCAAQPRLAAEAPRPAVVLEAQVISPYSEEQLERLFEEGKQLLTDGRYRDASERFERLLRLAPDGPTAAPSLFDAGVADEGLGDPKAALAKYDELSRRFPEEPMKRNTSQRRMRVLAAVEEWPRLVEASSAVLAMPDLSLLEALEARGFRALGYVEQDLVGDADRDVLQARDVIDQHRLGEAGKPPVEIATVSFALAEVRKRKSEAITFVPVPTDFADALERRCSGLLAAQNAYTDAMRALDARWSAMAGYRIGQLYQTLHRDVMNVPIPMQADTPQRKQLFEGAMRLRYRVLLEKGLRMMDSTVKMGERTGESSPWIARAREAKQELELALADEKASLAKLPYSEDELKAALDSLKK